MILIASVVFWRIDTCRLEGSWTSNWAFSTLANLRGGEGHWPCSSFSSFAHRGYWWSITTVRVSPQGWGGGGLVRIPFGRWAVVLALSGPRNSVSEPACFCFWHYVLVNFRASLSHCYCWLYILLFGTFHCCHFTFIFNVVFQLNIVIITSNVNHFVNWSIWRKIDKDEDVVNFLKRVRNWSLKWMLCSFLRRARDLFWSLCDHFTSWSFVL